MFPPVLHDVPDSFACCKLPRVQNTICKLPVNHFNHSFLHDWQELLQQLQQGDAKALARSISLVENEQPGYEALLQSLTFFSCKNYWYHRPARCGQKHIG